MVRIVCKGLPQREESGSQRQSPSGANFAMLCLGREVQGLDFEPGSDQSKGRAGGRKQKAEWLIPIDMGMPSSLGAGLLVPELS